MKRKRVLRYHISKNSKFSLKRSIKSMTVLGFFLNWLNFWSHVCTTFVKCHLTVVEWTEIHEALALDVLPGKTGHLERKTLGRPSWAPAAKKVNGWACSGCRCLSGRAGWHWKRCWFCDIAAFVYSRPLRHNHLDTASFAGPLVSQQNFTWCRRSSTFYQLFSWRCALQATYPWWLASLSGWFCWLSLAAGCTKLAKLDLSRKRGKVDRLCVVREDDGKGTLWRLQRGTCNLQLQKSLTESFGVLQTVQTGVFKSDPRWIKRSPCCFRPSRNGNLQRSCCNALDELEDQNIESGATKRFVPGLVDSPFQAFCFATAHFL